MNTVELFSGTKSFSKIAEKFGHNTFTVDNEKKLNPDWCVDIMNIGPWETNTIDILWASPPCTAFSVAAISHYWTGGKEKYIPKNEKTQYFINLVDKTIEIIAETEPKFWFIENPRGVLRKIIDPLFKKHGINDYKRETITYCQYGHKIMKPTDIWTNAKNWKPRPMCKNGAPCHERASRGAKTGLQGIYNKKWEKARGGNAIERGRIPEELFYEIFKFL